MGGWVPSGIKLCQVMPAVRSRNSCWIPASTVGCVIKSTAVPARYLDAARSPWWAMFVAAQAVAAQLWLGVPPGQIGVTQEIFGVRQLTSAVSDDAPPRKVGLGADSGMIVVGIPVCGLPSDAWICFAMTL